MQKNNLSRSPTDGVEVIFYTDPLCCWSWAMEPSWRQLRQDYGESLRLSYKMGGLIPSWQHFRDTANSISRPSQMGPEWMQAASLTGAKINNQIWINDPPASSYPACIAVKSVQMQSQSLAEAYLHMLWEVVMVENKNIARTDVLLELAESLSKRYTGFNLMAFQSNLLGEKGKEELRKDLQEAKYLNINRFPTLIIKYNGQPSVMLTGYQSYGILRIAIGSGIDLIKPQDMEHIDKKQ
jgi:putative protein-disulfide isomerase